MEGQAACKSLRALVCLVGCAFFWANLGGPLCSLMCLGSGHYVGHGAVEVDGQKCVMGPPMIVTCCVSLSHDIPIDFLDW